MTIQETSIDAYRTIQHDLGPRLLAVYSIFRARAMSSDSSVTDQELASALIWPINRVTPRRLELEQAGLIERCGTKIGMSGRMVHCWKLSQKV